MILVGPLGLEPRLFCTKNRRVASYTMGQYLKLAVNFGANLTTKFNYIISEKDKSKDFILSDTNAKEGTAFSLQTIIKS